jgi:hypothetical protein
MHSKLIMVVEDDGDLRQLYVDALKRVQNSSLFKYQRCGVLVEGQIVLDAFMGSGTAEYRRKST